MRLGKDGDDAEGAETPNHGTRDAIRIDVGSLAYESVGADSGQSCYADYFPGVVHVRLLVFLERKQKINRLIPTAIEVEILNHLSRICGKPVVFALSEDIYFNIHSKKVIFNKSTWVAIININHLM